MTVWLTSTTLALGIMFFSEDHRFLGVIFFYCCLWPYRKNPVKGLASILRLFFFDDATLLFEAKLGPTDLSHSPEAKKFWDFTFWISIFHQLWRQIFLVSLFDIKLFLCQFFLDSKCLVSKKSRLSSPSPPQKMYLFYQLKDFLWKSTVSNPMRNPLEKIPTRWKYTFLSNQKIVLESHRVQNHRKSFRHPPPWKKCTFLTPKKIVKKIYKNLRFLGEEKFPGKMFRSKKKASVVNLLKKINLQLIFKSLFCIHEISSVYIR